MQYQAWWIVYQVEAMVTTSSKRFISARRVIIVPRQLTKVWNSDRRVYCGEQPYPLLYYFDTMKVLTGQFMQPCYLFLSLFYKIVHQLLRMWNHMRHAVIVIFPYRRHGCKLNSSLQTTPNFTISIALPSVVASLSIMKEKIVSQLRLTYKAD